MATLRATRIAAGVGSNSLLRVSRVAAGAAVSGGTLRVQRIAAITGSAAGTLRVQRIAAGVDAKVAFTVTASSNITAPAKTYTPVRFTATATPPVGDTIVSWSWVALSSGAPPLSSNTAQNPTTRVRPELTARSHSWQLTVTSSSGAQGTATVTVPVQRAQYAQADPVTGALTTPVAMIGRFPSAPVTPPPAGNTKLRIRRVAAGVVGQEVVTPPPPDPGTQLLLVGGRTRYPGGDTEANDFAHGESDFGQLQVTKDYFAAALPTKYNNPFPSRVLIVLSMSTGVDYANDPNFAAFVRSLAPGTILTYQHEPERPTFTWTGAQYVAKLNDYRQKVRAVRTDCPVWLISSGYQYRVGNPGYDGSFFAGLNVDGYGIDTYRAGTDYRTQGQDVIALQLRDEFNRWKSFVPAGKPWGLTETGFGWVNMTGTVSDIVQRRIDGMGATFNWMVQQPNCRILLYFFSGEGPDGHNWLPDDAGFKSLYQSFSRGV